MSTTPVYTYTYDHIHVRTKDPEGMAGFFETMFGAKVLRLIQSDGAPRVDLDVNGLAIFIASVPPEEHIDAESSRSAPGPGSLRLPRGRHRRRGGGPARQGRGDLRGAAHHPPRRPHRLRPRPRRRAHRDPAAGRLRVDGRIAGPALSGGGVGPAGLLMADAGGGASNSNRPANASGTSNPIKDSISRENHPYNLRAIRRLVVPFCSSSSDVEQIALFPWRSTLRYANIAMSTSEYVGQDVTRSAMSAAKRATPAAAVAMVTMPRHIVFQWCSHS